MSKPYGDQNNGGGQPEMYQASDGKWYPTSQMPQNWDQNQGQNRGYYGQQQPMGYGGPQQYGQQGYGGYQQQPVYVQSRPGGGGGMGAGAAGGMGCLAALCAGLLCFDLGACLF